MKRFLEKWTLWLPPLLATLFFVTLSRVTYFRYENSDDFLIARTFLGFEGMRPVPPHLYLHPALVWVLNALSAAAPGVAWFSVAQLGMLWISAAVLCLCLLRCGRAARLHSVVCSLAALLFLGVFASFLCTRLTYTTTSALLAAAASALLVCAGVIRRRVAPCVLLSAALLTLGGMLRGTSLPASLCFWALSLAFLCVRLAGGEAHERRALLRALVPAIVVGAVLTGVRLWEKREYAAFFDFHDARIELMDYHPQALDSVSQETLDALGWDASEVELVRQWYFMDENITADALRLIQNGSAQASLTERLQNVPRTLRNFFEENPAYLFSVLLLVVLTVLACLVPHGSAGLDASDRTGGPGPVCGHAGLSGLARPFFGPRSGLCAAAGGGRGSLPGGVWPAVGIKAAHPHGRALPVCAAAPSRGNAAQTNAVHAHPPTGYRIAHPGGGPGGLCPGTPGPPHRAHTRPAARHASVSRRFRRHSGQHPDLGRLAMPHARLERAAGAFRL